MRMHALEKTSSKRRLKRRLERIERQIKEQEVPVVTVYMWTPGGKDPRYNGGRIRIRALTEQQHKEMVQR